MYVVQSTQIDRLVCWLVNYINLDGETGLLKRLSGFDRLVC